MEVRRKKSVKGGAKRGRGGVRLLGPEGQIWVFFFMSLPLL